ncbi:MAG: Pr6Pr family membrane protein [Rhizobiaceae bacterium]
MDKPLAITGFAVGAFAVILQFALTIPARMNAGRDLAEALVFFFSFFTILTNIGAVLVYAASLLRGRLSFFATPLARAAIAVCITIVGLVYATVLAKIWAPEGLFWLCDVLLHYAAPVIYALWWLTAGRSGTLQWSDAPRMLVFPVLYLVYAMMRGLLTGLYPYPFIDAAALGLGPALVNAAVVALVFLVFSFGAVALDRRLKSP